MQTYQDFVGRVNEMGLYPLSENPWGLPSLNADTKAAQWHSGIFDDDPWRWKNKIAAEGHALYGHVPGGRLCFISMKWLPIFFAAFRNPRNLEERYEDGMVDRRSLEIIRAFREIPVMPTFEVRRRLGIPTKEKGKLDGAIKRLQREMLLCIGGEAYHISQKGEPYGWPVNEIRLAEAFYLAEIEKATEIPAVEARAEITVLVEKLGGNLSAARFFP